MPQITGVDHAAAPRATDGAGGDEGAPPLAGTLMGAAVTAGARTMPTRLDRGAMWRTSPGRVSASHTAAIETANQHT